jgi:hypothetical protein
MLSELFENRKHFLSLELALFKERDEKIRKIPFLCDCVLVGKKTAEKRIKWK